MRSKVDDDSYSFKENGNVNQTEMYVCLGMTRDRLLHCNLFLRTGLKSPCVSCAKAVTNTDEDQV